MLILFEGLDGSGKSTQVQLLQETFNSQGISCEIHRTRLLGTRLLADAVSPSAGSSPPLPLEVAAHVFDAVHFDHSTLRPALAKGKTVLWDRGTLSYFAYSRARGYISDWTDALLETLSVPDVVFYLRVDPRAAMNRISRRHALDGQLQPHENESFLTKVGIEFEHIIGQAPDVCVIDAHQTQKKIAQDIRNYLSVVLSAK